ncbi:MAG TPA: DUF1800 domain-containing protein, partial [Gemmataceae bacterium]|nr:DUF1800 domain-containing protein [Gemmataceae bacterium]
MIDPRWAWEPYRTTAENPWDLRKAGHLYRRAAFGAIWDELQTAVADGPDTAVEKLLRGRDDAGFEKNCQTMAASIGRFNNDGQLATWWLYRLVTANPHPLREKMTLFWHNHFATSNAKVRNAGYMLGMYDLMSRHALGNFADLLQDISKDPAMMVWLDTAQSKKGQPNENYARELMELFSLGIGNYTEKDIREAARAFTGWEIKDGKAVLNANQHDDGPKSVLGRTGDWQGEDIVRICLEQESCSYFICGKLFKFLVSETMPPTRELLAPLADQFRKSGWDFGALVATVLKSNLFFDPQAYRTKVKAPVEFAVGIVRGLEGNPTPLSEFGRRLEGLGQHLFHPPSVKGWDGGPAWLNAQTLLYRQNLALALTSFNDNQLVLHGDPAALAQKHGRSDDAGIVDFFLALFLQSDV